MYPSSRVKCKWDVYKSYCFKFEKNKTNTEQQPTMSKPESQAYVKNSKVDVPRVGTNDKPSNMMRIKLGFVQNKVAVVKADTEHYGRPLIDEDQTVEWCGSCDMLTINPTNPRTTIATWGMTNMHGVPYAYDNFCLDASLFQPGREVFFPILKKGRGYVPTRSHFGEYSHWLVYRVVKSDDESCDLIMTSSVVEKK